MKKSILYQCAYGALAAALISCPAVAQTANTPAPSKGDQGIAQVVVTAQRFSESVQKTSLAVDVLNAKQLQGIKDIRQLQTIAPGVTITATGGVYNTYIRGVGSITAQVNAENSVTYNEDGVLLFTSTMITPLMFDLSRVEILLGPQGTLYGRNASGGAVNLITHDASTHGYEGFIEGEYGNFNLGRVTGAVNIPVSDTLAVRFAGEHVQHDGYLSDGTDDQNQTAGRMRLLWKPTPQVTVHLGLDGSVNRHKAPGFGAIPNPTNDKWVGLMDPRIANVPGALFDRSDAVLHPLYFHDDQWGVFGQVDADLGFATLTVLPAYRDENLDYHDYSPGFPEFQAAQTKQTSLEVRLGHQSERLKWVVGAYYLNMDQPSTFHVIPNATTDFIINNPTSLKSYAVFGQATVSVTPTTRLIGGLRYTKNDKTSTGRDNNVLVPAASFNFSYPESDSAVTWKAGVEQDLTPDSMLYFTASRGFKGGGTYIDSDPTDKNPSFRPEFVTAYEFGSRNQFFNHTLQLNVEGFYWQIENQQITYLKPNMQGVPTLTTVNAASASLYGVSFDGIWKPTPDDTIRLSAQYEHSRYDSFVRTVFLPILTTTCQLKNAIVIPGVGPLQADVDCSGKPLFRAPEWVGSAGYEHRFDLNTYGDLLFDVDTTFSTATYLSPDETELFKRPAYALWNMAVTYEPPGHAFSASVWVKNLADQQIVNGGAQQVPTIAAPVNFIQAVYLPPRTYGVTVRYSF